MTDRAREARSGRSERGEHVPSSTPTGARVTLGEKIEWILVELALLRERIEHVAEVGDATHAQAKKTNGRVNGHDAELLVLATLERERDARRARRTHVALALGAVVLGWALNSLGVGH